MKINKKGFTLIELLAVIVILAVVMLIAATAVIPMMTKSRQNALLDEGYALEKAAKLAYQDPTNTLLVGRTICVDMEYLKMNNFYEKGSGEKYYGSVLITPTDVAKGTFTTKFWITNSNYFFKEATDTITKYTNANTYNNSGDSAQSVLKACGNATTYATKCTTNNMASCNWLSN